LVKEAKSEGGIIVSGIIRMFAIVLLLSAASVIAQVAKPAEPHTVSQVVDF
jgi:hypothetical protein